MPSCLVTGGAGFIGSHLVRSLLKDGWEIRILDNMETGKYENLQDIQRHVRLIVGDIRDAGTLRTAMTGAEVVFHLAAMVSVPRSIKEPMLCHDINASGTLNVLELAKSEWVRRVVYAASSSAYGHAGKRPLDEYTPLSPLSPYAAAKLAGEHYCLAYQYLSELETVRLRFFNVFGARQDPSSPYSGVISVFCSRLINGLPITIHGDGKQTRDFVSVHDVVGALKTAATTEGISGNVYNIGTGKSMTINEVARSIHKYFKNLPAPVHIETRAGDVRHSVANITAAKRDLGFAPKVSFAKAIDECLDYYQELE